MKKYLTLFLIPLVLISCTSKKGDKKNAVEVSNRMNYSIENTNTPKTKELNWFYEIKTDESPSEEPPEIKELLKKNDGYYLGDTSKKIIYLTFDEGYENGNTNTILKILKDNDVPAAFFVTAPYIRDNKDIIVNMEKDGHFVCNHSKSHHSMAKIYDKEAFKKEIEGCSVEYYRVTGKEMKKYFRPPMGKYSELSLIYTKELNYKTIFWSFAYVDWEVKNQPTRDYAIKTIMDRTHPGGIFLLHAVSNTNAKILDEVLKKWKERGYSFGTLDQL